MLHPNNMQVCSSLKDIINQNTPLWINFNPVYQTNIISKFVYQKDVKGLTHIIKTNAGVSKEKKHIRS